MRNSHALFEPLEDVVVSFVRPNPHRVKIAVNAARYCPVLAADGNRPNFSFGLKAERRMKWIPLEGLIFFVRQPLNLPRQLSVEFAKAGRQKGAQAIHR